MGDGEFYIYVLLYFEGRGSQRASRTEWRRVELKRRLHLKIYMIR